MSASKNAFTVEDISIIAKKTEKTPELDAIDKQMQKHGYPSAYDVLPKATYETTSFVLNNTFASFANAVRRCLVEEIATESMYVSADDIHTDDEFIAGIKDMLIKNLSLIPIRQGLSIGDEYEIHLQVYNNSNNVLAVKTSEVKVRRRKATAKPEKRTVRPIVKSSQSRKPTKLTDTSVEIEDLGDDLDDADDADADLETDEPNYSVETGDSEFDLIPEPNVTLIRLRPGKYLNIDRIFIRRGYAYDDAASFTLLNNVKYKPLDIEPFDQFTGLGEKTEHKLSKKFYLEFTTSGNISSKEVIRLAVDRLTEDLLDIKMKIETYAEAVTQANNTFYNGENCSVEVVESVTTYKFPGHYITQMYMIGMRCFLLDETIQFVSPSVERFDSVVGIIRMKHADCNKLLLQSIQANIDDLTQVRKAFKLSA